MDKDELNKILDNHARWVIDRADGERADLSYANLSYADLSSANLSYASLSSANLSSANLSYASGNMKEIKSLFVEQYIITYNHEYLHIGCKRHPIVEWWGFDDKAILNMDGKAALKFWRKWKSYIQQTIELSPAVKREPRNTK